MKLGLFTNLDIPALFALNRLIPRLHGHDVTVYYSKAVGTQNDHQPPILKEYQLMEQRLFFDALLPVIQDLNQNPKAPLLDFYTLLKQHKIQSFEFSHVNSDKGLEYLKQQSHDLWLSIRFGKIFKQEAISIPKQGIINLHSGILPDYQGVMPTFRAMLDNQNHIGCTLHRIDNENIDSGPIIAYSKTALDKTHSYLWNVIQLYQSGVDIMIDALRNMTKQPSWQFITPQHKGHYYSFPKQNTLDQFFSKGYQLYQIDDIKMIFQNLLCSRKF